MRVQHLPDMGIDREGVDMVQGEQADALRHLDAHAAQPHERGFRVRIVHLAHRLQIDLARNDLPRGPFACPSSQASQKHEAVHYGINENQASVRNGDTRTISTIRSASTRALVFDMDARGTGGNDWANPAASNKSNMYRTSNGGGIWRHMAGKGANVCFVDGHVEARSRDSIPEKATTDDDGYFWAVTDSSGNITGK